MTLTSNALRNSCMTLAIVGSAFIAGCGNTSVIEKQDTRYEVSAVDEDRDDAIAQVKERALEVCEEQDRDKYDVLDSRVFGPHDATAKAADGNDQLEGGTVNEDTEMAAATHEGEGYKVVWTVRCR
ncbi:MAG: hypothetical protein CL810_07955 [Cobetia sp.]|uniref:hypothetical protein n=1 Tax=Cobetia TaxID=204286 RepID=UPI000C482FC1|nr:MULTISPECIES: hypothetical protein [Cobetia]MBK09481.1 hypothetical protein [Cobetia sp.]MBU3006949.1 hypothetical protein [Cobetia amphilecti]MCK8066662.1 hypothetical protein [Cobetia sp. 1CM21F]MDI4659996.1 hypothetical protein [Cobetia sp. BMC6]MDL2192053.1 hypothetical protein [Cobetia sp. LC6]|tara:strand:+ start:18003 stop:18380 length:378 start_codon:yes stop_codon:yes gene_type:complete